MSFSILKTRKLQGNKNLFREIAKEIKLHQTPDEYTDFKKRWQDSFHYNERAYEFEIENIPHINVRVGYTEFRIRKNYNDQTLEMWKFIRIAKKKFWHRQEYGWKKIYKAQELCDYIEPFNFRRKYKQQWDKTT